MDFRKTLKYLRIVQTVSNEERHKNGLKRLGRGYFNAHRFNPYNPLSYVALIIILIVGILMFGFYSLGICQNTKTFSGEYDDGTLDKGYATYSYYEDKATLEYIKHGAFKFTSTSKYEGGGQKVSISGNYKHNKKDGIWAFTITLTDYPTNGGAYITGTKSLTASYTNGKPNGVWTYKYNIKKREKQYSLAGYTWSPYSSVPAQMVAANFNNGVLVGSVKFVNNPPYNEYNSITGQFDSNGNLTGTWIFKSPEKEKTVGFKNGILTSFVVREIASGRITAKDIDNEDMTIIKNDFIAGKITAAELNNYHIKVDTINVQNPISMILHEIISFRVLV